MTPVEIIGYVGYVVGAVIVLTSKTKTDNIKDLLQRVEILEKERDYAKEQHLVNQKAISNLEGQLASYKEIPLKNIAHSLDILTNSNKEILKVLQDSAVIAQAEAKRAKIVKTQPNHPLEVEIKE
jgi:hypothetical protein